MSPIPARDGTERSRHAFAVRLRPEKREEYQRLHEHVWPGIRERMVNHGIRNYSIFLCNDILFSYFEYAGTDLARDLADLADSPESQEWARITDVCQLPLAPSTHGAGHWAQATEVFHLDA